MTGPAAHWRRMEMLLLFGAGMSVVALICIIRWWSTDRQRIRRALEAVPPQSIATLRNAEVARIQGVVRYLDETAPLTSPIGRRPCAAWCVQVSGKNTAMLRVNEGGSFLVEDETGVARVNAVQCKTGIRTTTWVSLGILEEPPAHVEQWLLAQGVDATNALGITRQIECEEAVLDEGDELSVLGRVEFEYVDDPSAAEGYRDRPRRAVMVSPAGSMLLISDDSTVTGASSPVKRLLQRWAR